MTHAILLAAGLSLGQTAVDDEAHFESRIRPVLQTCLRCHGARKASSKLRVDSREALLKGGSRGPAVVPGKPVESVLIQAIAHQGPKAMRMPPGRKLPDQVVADFSAWIAKGAVWPKTPARTGLDSHDHWAFKPVKDVEPPADPTGWGVHPIDRFIQARLRLEGLGPVAAADRRVLLRRVTFDLVGLPPTPAEMDAFLADKSPDAFARVVDRLLASPRYGERWGRHWMDVVRYSDTAGDNADYPIPEIYRYRDYIIDSFNADKPFDQFVQEQLAGDILAVSPQRKQGNPELVHRSNKEYAERVVATGFLALCRRYATAPYEFWHLSLEDCIDTTGAAFLGLTMRCARCHDHKFDPITTEDYYGLYGIFASTAFPFAGSEEFASMNAHRRGFVPLVPNGAKVMAGYRQKLVALEAQIKKLEAAKPAERQKLDALRNELKQLQKLGLPADVAGAYAVQDGKPVEVRIQLKGEPDQPGPVARRSVPRFIEGSPVEFPADGSGRLQFAQWVTRPSNPLTARVIVNRIWQYHFGQGLVPTANNFGVRGEPPSHPQLLDYLAAQFVRHGWSIKWLHRCILQTKTYQLSSNPSPALLARDPGNRWLGRFSRRRLDAEALRDAMLMVSGRLDLSRPGPHPFPPIMSWRWTQHNPFKEVYPSNHRSVYLMTQRIQRHPYLALFDGPDPNSSTEKRTSSLVPLQALFLMNHPFVKEQAESFARKIVSHSPRQDERIRLACQLAWGRPATAGEIEAACDYIQRCQKLANSEQDAWTSYARIMLTANEFVFVD